MVSTPLARSLRRFELEAPAITRAITYPQDRHGASAVAWPGAVVRVSAAGLREAMRVRAPLLLAAGHGHVLTLHHALVSAAVVRGAQRRGAAVVAWTVNDPLRVTALARLGVDAIVSDDPRMVVDALATL
jgi:glycerophosphoryl diester phosphodiesterase